MKAKILFIITAIILLFSSCEKEVRDPGYFDGPTLSFNVATAAAGHFGLNQDPVTFEIIVTGGDNINEVRVFHLGGSNPVVPVPPIPARTPIAAGFLNPAAASITLPVTLNPATGMRRAVFSRPRVDLGLLGHGTSTVRLMAEIIVGGNKVFGIIDITIAGAAATPDNRFRVTYDGNASTGGVVPMDNTHYASAGAFVILGNSGSLVRTGQKFIGWNTQADGLGTTFAPRQRIAAMGSAHRVLFARWTPAATPTFRVVYHANGATNGSVPFDVNEYLPGDNAPVMGNIFGLERTGRIFVGWNTHADHTTPGAIRYATPTATVVTLAPMPTPGATLNLYAEWN